MSVVSPSTATTAHSRHSHRLSVPSGGASSSLSSSSYSATTTSTTKSSSSSFDFVNNNPIVTPSQYFARLTDVSQMDLQSALDQMKSLLSLSPSQTQKVFKMAYYRKQTKNHWARDDPAFAALQIVFLILSCIAYCIAFRGDSIISSTLKFCFHSIIINYIGAGVVIATLTRAVANQHLQNSYSSSHVKQNVEWLYAFDIHCNAFFPAFVLLYGLQFFLLQIVLGKSLVALSVSNTLYALAGVWYCYVTHLGYRGKIQPHTYYQMFL